MAGVTGSRGVTGLVLRQHDAGIEAQAASRGLPVTVSEDLALPYERTLFVSPPVEVPWDLLKVGFAFLERWEAAAPLGKVGYLAADVGPGPEKRVTKCVIRDLRVPVYAQELLFVRNCEGGRALLDVFAREREGAEEPRLAFLRALYEVKPLFCALPRSWTAKGSTEARSKAAARPPKGPATVLVEVKRNVFVRCRPGEEQMMLERYGRRGRGRERRAV